MRSVDLAFLAALIIIGLAAACLAGTLDADNYDSFADCMRGPGRGCECHYYKAKDCDQRPGEPATCNEYLDLWWDCRIHPVCIRFDLDFDLDVDLADFAIYQRTWK